MGLACFWEETLQTVKGAALEKAAASFLFGPVLLRSHGLDAGASLSAVFVCSALGRCPAHELIAGAMLTAVFNQA